MNESLNYSAGLHDHQMPMVNKWLDKNMTIDFEQEGFGFLDDATITEHGEPKGSLGRSQIKGTGKYRRNREDQPIDCIFEGNMQHAIKVIFFKVVLGS